MPKPTTASTCPRKGPKRKRSYARVSCTVPGCTETLARKNELDRHLRVVHQRDTSFHFCLVPGCTARWTGQQISNLKTHYIKVHQFEAANVCNVCGECWGPGQENIFKEHRQAKMCKAPPTIKDVPPPVQRYRMLAVSKKTVKKPSDETGKSSKAQPVNQDAVVPTTKATVPGHSTIPMALSIYDSSARLSLPPVAVLFDPNLGIPQVRYNIPWFSGHYYTLCPLEWLDANVDTQLRSAQWND